MDINEFSASKRQIFEVSVNLFASRSFEIITLPDIATAIGRTAGGIYNHFSSKQEILNLAYDFFSEHYFDTMLPVSAFKPKIQTESLHQIIRDMMFEFVDEYASLLQHILCIIHQRAHIDDRARDIYSEILIKQSIDYAEDVLDFLVIKERIEPVSTLTYARLLYSIRQSTFIRWKMDPTVEHYAVLRFEEDEMIDAVLSSIVDKRKSHQGINAPR